MATEIKQIRDESRGRTVLRVSGEMFRDDAELLVRIAGDLLVDSATAVTIDLADLDLIDSEAAHVLRSMSNKNGFDLEGVDVLLQTAIDEAERHDSSN